MKKSTVFIAITVTAFFVSAHQDAFTSQQNPKPISGQANPQAQNKNIPNKPKKKFRRRLPNYYGKVNVSLTQRATIYKMQEQYFYKIADLEEKIDQLKSARDQQVYNVLTDLQKQRLQFFKSGGGKKQN